MDSLKYIKSEINSTYSQLQSMYDQITMLTGMAKDKNDLRKEDSLKEYYKILTNKIYNLILVFFEKEGLIAYIERTKELIHPRLDNDNELFKVNFDEESGDFVNHFLNNIWLLLSPFEFFNQDSFMELYNRSDIMRLVSILENTDLILHYTKTKSTSEAQIYRPIKSLLKIIYPTTGESKGESFFSITKNYKPDILIPELKVSVEYKFINSKNDIPKSFGEIADDITNYKTESNAKAYEIFYSVFYFKGVPMTVKRFDKICAEKNMPKEWIPILVVERKFKEQKQ